MAPSSNGDHLLGGGFTEYILFFGVDSFLSWNKHLRT